MIAGFLAIAILNSHRTVRADSEAGSKAVAEKTALIDQALFTRVEFFGAQALVPYPTAEARDRLAALQAKYPQNPEIDLKLAQLDEKLGRQEDALKAMRSFLEHEPDKLAALDTMAAFADRRAQFSAEAEAREQLLQLAPPSRRGEIFRQLISLAETHLLDKYLAPAFYEQTLAQNPQLYEIFEQYLEHLSKTSSYPEALKVLRAHKDRFPDQSSQLLEKEVSLLENMGRDKEAEAVYVKAFDPFWPNDLLASFYGFLKQHDRFRAYGSELREAFRRDPANFAVAVRLLHYEKETGREAPEVFVRLEKARGTRHQAWQPDELVTITRLLLAEGYGDAASRFLYTLSLQGRLQPGTELRAKVLYQIFEVLSDARNEKLSLTRGDLKFYQDIATVDPHPGLLGGILSLLLSDTDPSRELKKEEERAAGHFNRAAAYRVFTAYKQEYPTSPELAQMYLDIVRLYAATATTAPTDAPAIAAETLSEFEKRYSDAPQYPEVALRLADCYIALGKSEEERQLYQRILDYLGQHRQNDVRLVPSSTRPLTPSEATAQLPQALDISAEPTSIKPSLIYYPAASNQGIHIPTGVGATAGGDSDDRSSATTYADFLARSERTAANSEREESSGSIIRPGGVEYATVLARYVASLDKDNRGSEILALYANEIKKYGAEQGLYEQLLQWLGQTNMVDEQLRIYQETIRKFPTTAWRDRLARWFIKQQRKQEFEAFSRDLLGKLNDDEVAHYLQSFIDSGAGASASTFDANLYLGLYTLAHERFPHNLTFTGGLLRFYSAHNDWQRWRRLVAEYYFVSRDIRDQFLAHLASRGELRAYFARAQETLGANQNPAAQSLLALLPYRLFRADSAVWLSNYEAAVAGYRELNQLYPNTLEFAERLIALTRSLGQHERKSLAEAGALAHEQAEAIPSEPGYRTRAGEIQAELGDYQRARGEWEQLIALGRGVPETYLDTATVYWDYFQYDDALRTLKTLRAQSKDETLYAFQVGAILESKHQLPAAIAEYVKALNNDGGDDLRAKARLVKLSQRDGVFGQISLAFNQERRRFADDSSLVLEYVDFLSRAKRWDAGAALLRTAAARSTSAEFLKQARAVFTNHEDAAGEILALRRLVVVATGPRLPIAYRLQLAASYDQLGQRQAAAGVVRDLVQKFPTNYGVLNEAADFYWRLGRRADSLNVLRVSTGRGIGRFHYLFGRKLAARELELKHVAVAEHVLGKLHDDDPLNTEVFHELAKLYVRGGNTVALRARFGATLAAIKGQNIDLNSMHAQVAELRGQMIDAFTRLKDYPTAVDQHIEIINREPDDEANLEAAINYVKRYGGAERLLAYYQRTSAQAYKNYRWNVVLARIYEAKGDQLNSARQYRAALQNQPEMLELYDALAGVYTRAKDYDSALETLKKAAELSNDDPLYLKRMIEVLEKAGRHREAEALRQKLPHEQPQALSVSNQFAEAARLRGSERQKAVTTYRDAFNAFSAAPFKHDLRAEEITGYVQTVRYEEPLDQITVRVWELRTRMVTEAERAGNPQAGKARAILGVLDSALPEAVGGVGAEKATGDELAALLSFLKQQVEVALKNGGDKTGTLACLQNLSRRAGFGLLEEQILIGQKNQSLALADMPVYHTRLRALIDFYSQRGAYRRVLEVVAGERVRDNAREQFEYPQLVAENARLLGDSQRELQAVREIYQRKPGPGSPAFAAWEPLVERYFEVLYETGDAGRTELLSCAEQSTSHQLQLINFLIAHDEKELAHTAIERAPLPIAWRLSRNAEASLSLGEFATANENYFLAALQFRPIGELIKQKPDTTMQLVGDDWFRLMRTYGRWLNDSANAGQILKSRSFLPALIENRPEDTSEQVRLGRWYLEKKDSARAVEHLRLAHEAKPDDKQIIADLGVATLLIGNRVGAEELWSQIISGDASLEDYQLYLNTLAKQGLAETARIRLTRLLSRTLAEDFQDENERSDDGWKKKMGQMKGLIRSLAESFGENQPAAEAAKVAFFRKLCEAAPANRLLPEYLLRQSLIARDEWGPFYQMLIARSAGLTSYDRDAAYAAQLQKSWDAAGAEEALDHETSYKRSEPDSKRTGWQKEYLAWLVERNDAAAARALITAIESTINRRYARPIWLRLAALRLDIRSGQLASASSALERLAGIETGANLTEIKPPDIERVNDAAELLREEGHESESISLLEAAYARALALGQYQPAYFAGLANIAFRRGDAVMGLKWLQLMVSLGKEDTRAEAEAEVASLPIIKKHVVDSPGVELPSGDSRIEQSKALSLAAELAGKSAQFVAALSYRQQLLTSSPDDEENRIELVRLLAANKKTGEAIENLAAIIGDRTTSRKLRWQAVWLAPELAERRPELWTTLRDRVRALNAKDSEMAVALQSLSLAAAGQPAEGIKVIADAEAKNPNPYLRVLQASLERKLGQDGNSLNNYLQVLVEGRDAAVLEAPGFSEDGPLDQIVRLYLKQNQPRAALRLVERNENYFVTLQLHADAEKSEESENALEMNEPVTEDARYQTLRARAALREREARLELLEFLSGAAERLGDFNRAIALEQARLALLSKASDRQAARDRLDRLRDQQKKLERRPRPGLVVDQQFVTAA